MCPSAEQLATPMSGGGCEGEAVFPGAGRQQRQAQWTVGQQHVASRVEQRLGRHGQHDHLWQKRPGTVGCRGLERRGRRFFVRHRRRWRRGMVPGVTRPQTTLFLFSEPRVDPRHCKDTRIDPTVADPLRSLGFDPHRNWDLRVLSNLDLHENLI